MAGVGISVDDADWQNAMSELASLVPEALVEAAIKSAVEVAHVAEGLLSISEHAAGTYSQAPAGAPPGTITGHLADSFEITPTDDGALVGPTAVYAREQELGGPMEGHMHWVNEGGSWYRRLVVLPKRPYLKPATDEVVASGMVDEFYAEALHDAILRVAVG